MERIASEQHMQDKYIWLITDLEAKTEGLHSGQKA